MTNRFFEAKNRLSLYPIFFRPVEPAITKDYGGQQIRVYSRPLAVKTSSMTIAGKTEKSPKLRAYFKGTR